MSNPIYCPICKAKLAKWDTTKGGKLISEDLICPDRVGCGYTVNLMYRSEKDEQTD